jgi:hypothetical protein
MSMQPRRFLWFYLGLGRRQVPDNAVVLASPWDSLIIVGSNGRFVVAVPREFSNPYVEFESREWGQRRMLDTLKGGDFDTFLRYAQLHHVDAVLLRESDASRLEALGRLPAGMTELSRQGGITLFKLERGADDEGNRETVYQAAMSWWPTTIRERPAETCARRRASQSPI